MLFINRYIYDIIKIKKFYVFIFSAARKSFPGKRKLVESGETEKEGRASLFKAKKDSSKHKLLILKTMENNLASLDIKNRFDLYLLN